MFEAIENVTEVIGTMTGHRAVVFTIECEDDSTCKVTFDFYGTGSQFNGATYARMEQAMLRSLGRSGRTAKDWKAFKVTL